MRSSSRHLYSHRHSVWFRVVVSRNTMPNISFLPRKPLPPPSKLVLPLADNKDRKSILEKTRHCVSHCIRRSFNIQSADRRVFQYPLCADRVVVLLVQQADKMDIPYCLCCNDSVPSYCRSSTFHISCFWNSSSICQKQNRPDS